MRAAAIRDNAMRFERESRIHRETIKGLRQNRDLTADARERMIAKHRQELHELHDRYAVNQRGLFDAIVQEVAAVDPGAMMRAAARKDPVRANALGELADNASDAEYAAHVRDAARETERDLVFAYAFANATERLNRIPEEQRAELHRTLREIAITPAAAKAQAELVVGRVELARFESLRNPLDSVGTVTRYREAITVDLGEGPRMLTDAEVRERYALCRMAPDVAVVMPAEDIEPTPARTEPFHEEHDDLMPAA